MWSTGKEKKKKMRIDSFHVVVISMYMRNFFFIESFDDWMILLSRDLIMTMGEKKEMGWDGAEKEE